jgi:hypothetical protein
MLQSLIAPVGQNERANTQELFRRKLKLPEHKHEPGKTHHPKVPEHKHHNFTRSHRVSVNSLMEILANHS